MEAKRVRMERNLDHSHALKSVKMVTNEIIFQTALEDALKEQHHVVAKEKILSALIQNSIHVKITQWTLQNTQHNGE